MASHMASMDVVGHDRKESFWDNSWRQAWQILQRAPRFKIIKIT